jgi:hypothetical protein
LYDGDLSLLGDTWYRSAAVFGNKGFIFMYAIDDHRTFENLESTVKMIMEILG